MLLANSEALKGNVSLFELMFECDGEMYIMYEQIAGMWVDLQNACKTDQEKIEAKKNKPTNQPPSMPDKSVWKG